MLFRNFKNNIKKEQILLSYKYPKYWRWLTRCSFCVITKSLYCPKYVREGLFIHTYALVYLQLSVHQITTLAFFDYLLFVAVPMFFKTPSSLLLLYCEKFISLFNASLSDSICYDYLLNITYFMRRGFFFLLTFSFHFMLLMEEDCWRVGCWTTKSIFSCLYYAA